MLATNGGEDHVQRADAAECREDALHGMLVEVCLARGHHIGHEDLFVAALMRRTRRRFYTDVRRDAAEDDRPDTAPPELHIEVA